MSVLCLPAISKRVCMRAMTVHPVFAQRFGTLLLRKCPGDVCHCAFSLVVSCLWGNNGCIEWLRFKRDWFIFIWFSLIVYWCRDNYNYIFHSVSCTYTDILAFRKHVLCIRFAKHTLFDLGALLSPRLSVFCTFAYLNLFCLIYVAWSASFLLQ